MQIWEFPNIMSMIVWKFTQKNQDSKGVSEYIRIIFWYNAMFCFAFEFEGEKFAHFQPMRRLVIFFNKNLNANLGIPK